MQEKPQTTKEEKYQEHIASEVNWPIGFHPDGCWYCGSHNHPSDCCPDQNAVSEAWDKQQ